MNLDVPFFYNLAFYDIVEIDSLEKREALAKRWGFRALFPSTHPSVLLAKNLADAFRFKKRRCIVFLEDYTPKPTLFKRWVMGKQRACLGLRLDLFRFSGWVLSKAIAKRRAFATAALKFGVPLVLASFAKEEELRSPFELVKIANLLGLNDGQAKMALMRSYFLTETTSPSPGSKGRIS